MKTSIRILLLFNDFLNKICEKHFKIGLHCQLIKRIKIWLGA